MDQQEEIEIKKKSNLLDKMGMWLGVPAALFLAERTKTLETVGKVAKQLTAKGKEKYYAYRSDFKYASIKPLFLIGLAMAVVLALFAVLARVSLAESNAVADGMLFVMGVPILALVIYTFRLPPIPQYSKVNGVYELEPETETEEIDGVETEVPNPLAGQRILQNEKEIDLERFSLVFGIALISACGYAGSSILFVIAGFGHSAIPAILALVLLVVTRKMTRAVGKMITWSLEKAGDFIEWASGTLSVHLAVLEAGKTYESVKTGPIELFNQKLPWTAFSNAESSGAFGLLILAFFMVVSPSPEMFQIITSIIMAGWIVLMMMEEIDASDRIKGRRERVVRFFEGRATAAAMVMIPMGVLLPDQTRELGPRLKAAITGAWEYLWHPSKFCQFINVTAVWTNVGILVLSGGILWLLYRIWDSVTTSINIKREKQKNASAHKGFERGLTAILGFAGLAMLFVAGFSVTGIFASLKPESSFCGVQVPASTVTNQAAAPVSSASKQQAGIQAPQQQVIPAASSAPIDQDPVEERIEEVAEHAGKVVNKSPPPARMRIFTVPAEAAKAPPEETVKTAVSDSADSDSDGRVPSFRAYRQRRLQRQ
jgi:hypothetical protein